VNVTVEVSVFVDVPALFCSVTDAVFVTAAVGAA
jgi:hypothetical protein